MLDDLTIEKVKQLLTAGKSEAAADMLLKHVNETHSKHYEAALLLKNRIESVQQQEIEGIISQTDKNLEWAKISKAVLTLTLKIEREESPRIETKPSEEGTTSSIFSNFSLKKVLFLMALVGIPLLVYTLMPRTKAAETVNIEVQAFKMDKNTAFTEGGKLRLQVNEKETKDVYLNTTGKAILNDFTWEQVTDKLHFQWVDSQLYTLVRQDFTHLKDNKVVQLFFEEKKLHFSGKVLNSDNIPVEGVTIDFGNGKAEALSDAQGHYTVQLPVNIGEHVDIILRKNNKTLISKNVFVSQKVFEVLKVP
jgi:Effector-associated domain 11